MIRQEPNCPDQKCSHRGLILSFLPGTVYMVHVTLIFPNYRKKLIIFLKCLNETVGTGKVADKVKKP